MEKKFKQMKNMKDSFRPCGWCNEMVKAMPSGKWVRSEKIHSDISKNPVSHSICPSCTDRARRDIKQFQDEELEE